MMTRGGPKRFIFSEEFQCRFSVPALGDIAFKHFTLVIDSAPQVVRFTVDLHKNLVKMPLPIRMSAKVLNSFSSDLRGKQWTEPDPPETDRLMANIDTAFVQQILHVPKRKSISNVHHHRQADDLWARFEVLEWVTFCHPETLNCHPARLKLVFSGKDLQRPLMGRCRLNLPGASFDRERAGFSLSPPRGPHHRER